MNRLPLSPCKLPRVNIDLSRLIAYQPKYRIYSLYFLLPWDWQCKVVWKIDTVRGRQGRQKIIPKKNVEKISTFIKYFVEVNKNEANKKPKKNTTKSTSCRNLQYHSCKISSYQNTKLIKHIHMLHAYPKTSWPLPTNFLPTSLSLGYKFSFPWVLRHLTHAPLVLLCPH